MHFEHAKPSPNESDVGKILPTHFRPTVAFRDVFANFVNAFFAWCDWNDLDPNAVAFQHWLECDSVLCKCFRNAFGPDSSYLVIQNEFREPDVVEVVVEAVRR